MDRKLDQTKSPLSDKEQSERKRLDHAILEGDVNEIEAILKAHKDDPAALNRVLSDVNEDLSEAGIHISWQTGKMMMGDDKNYHPAGYLTIYPE